MLEGFHKTACCVMVDVTQYAKLIVLKYEPRKDLITSGGEIKKL